MNTRKNINTFLQGKNLAIAGVSRDEKKFGNIIFLHSVNDLTNNMQNLLIVTNKRDTKSVLVDAVSKGIKNIWIQNGCETDEVINYAKKNDINLVSKACFLMYANPTGFHKFHQTIFKWFGKYVKE